MVEESVDDLVRKLEAKGKKIKVVEEGGSAKGNSAKESSSDDEGI